VADVFEDSTLEATAIKEAFKQPAILLYEISSNNSRSGLMIG